jgi:glycerol-3-phosphate acyltransferase PlsY
MNSLATLAWIGVAFVSGALPFSVWLGRAVTGRDVRRTGDGNPGAANAWRVGGWRLGLVVLVLDFLKGALPVLAAHFGARLAGWPLAATAVAPVAGHAFSPFLAGRGGKGLTVTFGVWTGLTLAQVPLILGLFLVLFYAVQRADAWSVVFSLAGVLAHLLWLPASGTLLAVWVGNMLILTWKHRQALRQAPGLRPQAVRWVAGALGRRTRQA